MRLIIATAGLVILMLPTLAAAGTSCTAPAATTCKTLIWSMGNAHLVDQDTRPQQPRTIATNLNRLRRIFDGVVYLTD
jgi:hypothetical protein